MTIEKRIELLVQLGQRLLAGDDYLDALIKRTYFNNKWLTEENYHRAISAIAGNFLDLEKLNKWIAPYGIIAPKKVLTVGIIMAGNIPLVGFHDFLCVFICGHKSQIKLSEKDAFVFPYLLKMMSQIDSDFINYYEEVDQLNGFDAVIATGSNNTSRYFEQYFGKYPNIIRKNRNSVAVLTGKETDDDLRRLGEDIFNYFGLGCRNVSKIYIPKGYDLKRLLEILHEFREIVNHDKYRNNFDYNFALYSLNKMPFDINGGIILLEDKSLHSRIASLHYEYYDSMDLLKKDLDLREKEIQCVVAEAEVFASKSIPFGKSQAPELFDYADNVDVIAWLMGLQE